MFKQILENLLAEKSINQRKLSIETKIPATTISGWMNAGRLPDYRAIRTLAIYFNVSADYLLGIEDEDGHREVEEYEFSYEDKFQKFTHKEKQK